MNTIEQFKHHMDWSVLPLTETEKENIFNNVDSESYVNMEELENDFDYEDSLISTDVNLHSVLENFSELIERGKLNNIDLYYLTEDNVYVGILTYDM